MSRILRKAERNSCRQYLKELDKLKAAAEAMDVVPVRQCQKVLGHDENSDSDDSQGGLMWSSAQCDDTVTEVENIEFGSDPGEDLGQGSWPPSSDTDDGNESIVDLLPHSSTQASPTYSRSIGGSRVSITREQLDKFDTYHATMTSIVDSLNKGLERIYKRDKTIFDNCWAEAMRPGGSGTLKKPQTGGSHRRSLLRHVLDNDWLWEQEVALAWEESGICYQLDDSGKHVHKL